jgi:hypothetical protein
MPDLNERSSLMKSGLTSHEATPVVDVGSIADEEKFVFRKPQPVLEEPLPLQERSVSKREE